MRKVWIAIVDIFYPIMAYFLISKIPGIQDAMLIILAVLAVWLYNLIRKKLYGYYAPFHPK